MTELPVSATLAAAIPGWMSTQRWYGGKGRDPKLEPSAAYRLTDPAGEADVVVHILLDSSGRHDAVYQVPTTIRRSAPPDLAAAMIATLRDDEESPRYVYDGCHDPAFARALLSVIATGSSTDAGTLASATGRAASTSAATSLGQVVSARVLTGEQSNTSIIIDLDGGSTTRAIAKVFRVLHDGDNPDVVLQSALAEAGSTLVPTPLGYLAGRWPDPDVEVGTARGHLAFVQEFLPGTVDAWRVALAALAENRDFTDRARALGTATAQVHRTLADALPTEEASPGAREALLEQWRARAAVALGEVPALAEHEQAIDAVYARAGEVAWPRMQRVHGDYHLGQVLDVPGRGWVLLDFEGEPLRPLHERSLPDQPLRDVAGMLRSFDYAAGSRVTSLASDAAPDSAATAQAWAAACRTAFLDGYAAEAPDTRSDSDLGALLAAFELDKALYEVVYEVRNRPTWLSIPTSAVARILAAASSVAARPTARPIPAAETTTASPTQMPIATKPTDEDDMTQPPTPTPNPDKAPATTPSGSDVSVSTPASTPSASTSTSPASTSPAPPSPPSSPSAGTIRPASWDELGLLVHGGHGNPHGVLGAHPYEGGVTIRTLRPMAAAVVVQLPDGSRHPMQHDFEGVWQVHLEIPSVSDYRLLVTYGDGFEHVQDDPYRFFPTVGDLDLHLIGEGRHEELWKVLGSHIREYDGPMGKVTGTSFAVWAPNARAIRVVGDFNTWDGTAHPMRALGSTGIWELFIPGVGENTTYKYEILGADGYRRTKADPLARATECPPQTASVVTRSHYEWQDSEWMEQRAKRDPINEAMSTYEVHFGSWRQGLSYTEAAEHLVNYVRDAGFTHVEFLPLAEHPYGPSWGYQVTGYYAPTSRFGSPDELRYLIDTLHQNGIGVIMDWVPAHFPKDGFALGRFDGQPLYEHPDPRRGEHKDWGTYIFDFGRPQVRNFLVANASYWLEEFHVDGLRVDAVASMLYLDYSREDGEWYPNQYGGRENIEAMELLQETNATVYKRYPGVVTLAEESTSWGGVTKPTYMGGLGFGLKWNMGWMHDSLGYVQQPAIYRQYHHHEMTFAMVYQYSENYCLPISHDEVVYGKGSMIRKMPGDWWESFANLRAFYTFMWAFPGKQLLFMGGEFAQYAEWADSASLDWWLLDHDPHWRMHKLVKDLNWLYKTHPALWELDNHWDGFGWIDANDASGNTFSWLRYGKTRDNGERPVVAAVVNFSGAEHSHYRIGLPHGGVWKEILNSDSVDYFGGGGGNMGQIVAEEVPWHGQPYSALITLPKYTGILFEPEQTPGGDEARKGTVGEARPELSNTPVMDEDAVDSGLGELPAVTDRE